MFSLSRNGQIALLMSIMATNSALMNGAEQIKLASNKLASFAQLINYQRTKLKMKEFNNTHVQALQDVYDAVDAACFSIVDIDPKSNDFVFDNLDAVSTLTNEIKKQLSEMAGVYGQLMVYNQKTTSIKSRVKNVFRKKGTEISTTSTEDKQAIKQDLMETRKQLVALVDKCIALKKQLSSLKAPSEPAKYALQLLTRFVEDALTPMVEYCIQDVTLI